VIKGVYVKAGYRRAAAGVVGCLLVGGALGTALHQAENAVPVSSSDSPSAASRVSLAWEPRFDRFGYGADGQSLPESLSPTLRELLTEEDSGFAAQTYTVLEGDSFWSIASEYNTDVDTLMSMNTFVQPELLQPGQKLNVARAFHGMTHTVQPGDTLTGIAADYAVTASQVRQANAMGRGSTLKVGEMIFVPGARPRETSRDMVVSRGAAVRRESAQPVATATAAPAPAPERTTAPAKPASAKSTWIWPLDGGLYSSEFGWRGNDFHEGIDIAVPTGTVAVAARGGTVAFAGYHDGYGYYVMINHGDGTKSRYAHASALLVTAGAVVDQGQPVIRVGSTGHSTGPHLHFEIIVDGKPCNPRDFLP
jgi:murein DD-endopeptidase MepM/ murein hydrolase activator NlpD